MSILLGPLRVWIGGEAAEVLTADVAIQPPVITPEATLDTAEPSSFEGWFCVRTDPYPCPAEGCGFVAGFQTAAHLIIVWERIDAQTLLVTADRCRRAGRNPRVVEYEDEFGPAISWEQWLDRGRPVHAYADRPDGWDSGMRL